MTSFVRDYNLGIKRKKTARTTWRNAIFVKQFKLKLRQFQYCYCLPTSHSSGVIIHSPVCWSSPQIQSIYFEWLVLLPFNFGIIASLRFACVRRILLMHIYTQFHNRRRSLDLPFFYLYMSICDLAERFTKCRRCDGPSLVLCALFRQKCDYRLIDT